MNAIVRLKDVTKVASGHRRSLNGVSLCVSKGEHLQICGAPGSGKAMLMRLISGMEPPGGGEIWVAGQAVHAMNQPMAASFRNKTFGVLLRDPGFFPGLTAWENVALPLTVRRTAAAQRKEQSIGLLDDLGLKYAACANPSQLSAYEKQLVSIARAWIANPDILLLDEITADLPIRESLRMMDTLGELCRRRETTVILFVAEEIRENFVGRQLTLDHGKIREESQ